ncbi:N-acetylglucosamine-6-phosphate deacetylase [Lederbergia sp. NSJ-179]|uniref:N-acetylglucosamine-6-phosphate deacetylase n=1 Tax=Lederbergia sp. NSJ-179 TaxID=2931402 RepID=UPI001FD304D6|nr:N-acetylglucosamine-6-phosphate deacetylase [Lederbergia sp. NSJ-179]MCJ7841231.1 N-acetylglucosamine-6-phosphate deacetylase [Lederbergia sp. NSJ-179]
MVSRLEGIDYKTNSPIHVYMENGMITDIQAIPDMQLDSLPILAPGLIDLQINGYKGFDFNTLPFSADSVIQVTRALWEEGVTTYFPTLITNCDDSIEQAIQTIIKACEKDRLTDSTIGGIHMEGPFISPEDGPRGAHNEKFIKAPDWSLLKKWQKIAKGRIKILTLSPEWEGAIAFIEKCSKNDVLVSIGHTAATNEQIRAAVKAGARMSTHLGNGAHLLLPRHPNYLWEQLANDHLWACLIADGFHLPLSFLKVAMKAKGTKTILVSDAVDLSGLDPGEYRTHIGGDVILTAEGKLHLKKNPELLAGSVQMLKHGITHLVNNQIADLSEAWEMASSRPAALIQLATKNGLVKGAPADLVLFKLKEKNIRIIETYKSGRRVYPCKAQ